MEELRAIEKESSHHQRREQQANYQRAVLHARELRRRCVSSLNHAYLFPIRSQCLKNSFTEASSLCSLRTKRLSAARRRLAQLQRANVGDDLPAIFDRYLRRVARHRAPAVRHDVKEVAHGCLSQFVLMKRRGRGFVEAAPRDHAVAITRQPVTRGAEYLIALLPAFENLFRDRKRKGFHVIGKHRGGLRTRTGLLPRCVYYPVATPTCRGSVS